MSSVICGVVLAGFLMVWALRNSEGLSLWLLRVVLVGALVAAGVIGAMDDEPWPTDFRVAEVHK